MLPKELHRYFWDVDANTIDLHAHERYVIERILELGDVEACAWLFQAFPKERILAVLNQSRLSPRSANFWRLTLNAEL